MAAFPVDVDRARRAPLAAQLYWAIREAIDTGQLPSGARLLSYLAAQDGA
jgi:GntR family transcriptional regulator / MocR family aminotransferase